ncbi:MAG TPA: copper chaperone PCu(A)C [Bordetella sp.]
MKVRSLTLAAMFGLAAACTSAWADDVRAGALDIKEPWARATVPGQANGAGYLEVDNTGTAPDRLVAVRSDAAEKVEVHTMTMDGGTAQMRQVEGGLEVPAGGKATLSPGGNHLMFIKLKAPFAAGSSVPVVLTFEKAGEVAVTLPVRPLGGMSHDTGNMNHGGMSGMSMPGMKN